MTQKTRTLFQRILAHPDVVKGPSPAGEYRAWCPWHPDRQGNNPSLGINERKLAVKCWVCGRGSVQELAETWDLVDSAREVPPWEKEIEATYDYHNADGSLRFQVVRFKVAPGTKKDILQRRPDKSKPDAWAWNLKSLKPVLYRLPELRAAAPGSVIWIVEGEKDADRLRELGLVATTNPMGANKWRKHFNEELAGFIVIIIPDNDDEGRGHATDVAGNLYGVAASVKVLELPDLPEKGDVSDWLDAGHTLAELLDLEASTPPYQPPPDSGDSDDVETNGHHPEWRISPRRWDAEKVTGRLQEHGFFVNGGQDPYFFDRASRQLLLLDKDEPFIKRMLTDRYKVNRQDDLFCYLVEHLVVEAEVRGQSALVRSFSYYDAEHNQVLLDMGKGRVLRITSNEIAVRENGADGVLFAPLPDHDPWDYRPDAPSNILYRQMIEPANFSEDGLLNVREQKLLLFEWVLSFAFESMMKTRPLMLAVGPGESGKSSLFRYIGQMLIGREFEVDSASQDGKGEEEFWTNVSNSLFICYDNVDQYIRWMADALAQVATGVRKSKRKLHTTNTLSRFSVRCMLALTARTPTFSLRREDVASRTLILTMCQLEVKRDEYETLREIARNRDLLLSDYARIVQKALRIPLDAVQVSDPGMRLADFAKVATRLGMGLGPEIHALTNSAFAKIRDSQFEFAVEEDEVANLLEIWIARSKEQKDGQLDMGAIPNNGRKVLVKNLWREFKGLAEEFKMGFHFNSDKTLGHRLKNLNAALSRMYEIESDRGRADGGSGTWYRFTLRHSGESEDAED